MRYIYNQDGRIVFVQCGDYIYNGQGQLLKNMRITDGNVYSGTEYVGYVVLDVFYPSENFKKLGDLNQRIGG